MIIKKLEKYIKEATNIEKLYVALIRSEASLSLQDPQDVWNTAYNEGLRDLVILIKKQIMVIGENNE